MKLLWAYWIISAEEGRPLQDIVFPPMRPDGKRFMEEGRGWNTPKPGTEQTERVRTEQEDKTHV